MALTSDKFGFLTGKPESGGDTRALDILAEIKGDTGAILAAMKKGAVEARRAVVLQRNLIRNPQQAANDKSLERVIERAARQNAVKERNTVQRQLPERDAMGRFVAKKAGAGQAGDRERAGTGQATGRQGSGNAQAAMPEVSGNEKNRLENLRRAEAKRQEAAERKRGADGRFSAGEGGDGDGAGEALKDAASKAADWLKSGADAAGSDVEKIDPILEASNEIKSTLGNVKGVLQVAATPLAMVAKPIWGWVRGNKKKDAAEKALPLHKKILKKLTDIEKKPSGGAGRGGLLGMMGGALAGIGGILMTVLGKIFNPVGTILKAAFMGGGKLLMGALRMVFGPVGAVLLAAFAGWQIGTWLYERYGPQIQAAIDAIAGGATTAWTWVKDTWNSAVEGVSSIGDYVMEKWNDAIGVVTDVFEGIGETWDKIVDFFGEKLGIAKEKLGVAKDTVREAAGNVADKVGSFFGVKGSSGENEKTLISEMAKTGMGKQEQAMFMANMAHESGGFQRMNEGLNYSSVGRIRSTFKNNKAIGNMTDEQVAGLVNNPEALANTVYGGRMGNKNAGDGFKFRGRGFTQLTGRDNYEMAGKALGIDLVNNPELAANPEIASKIALWKWQQSGASKAAKAGDIVGARKAINGGDIGLAETKALTAQYMGMDSIVPADTQRAVNAASMGNIVATTQVDAMTNQLAFNGTGPLKTASIPSPVLPSPQPVNTALASSGGKRESSQTVMPMPYIGQNMSDRNIAQLVTGGIGMGGV